MRALSPDTKLRAALYAAVHTGTPGDLAFHLGAAPDARRVLELGSGYGRVALALATAGREVVGIDLDPALTSLAHETLRDAPPEVRERIRLLPMDMRAIEAGVLGDDGRFDQVVLAHSTLYCLGTDDEVRTVLRSAHAQLREGGRLSIDAYSADAFHSNLDPEPDPFEEIVRVRVNGRTWRVLERSDWDEPAQVLVAHYRHLPVGGGRAVVSSIRHRYLLADALLALLAETGFRVLRVEGDLEGGPFSREAEHLAVVAERT